MAVANNDVLKAVWQAVHSDPNTIIENVFWFRITDAADPNEAQVGADVQLILTTMYTTIATLLADRYILRSIRVTDETQKTFLIDSDGLGFVGTGGAGEVLPAQDCGLVLARSRTLGHIGRKYVGPMLENTFENGALGAGAKAALGLFADDYESTVTAPVSNNVIEPGTAKVAAGGAVESFRPFQAGLCSVLDDARTQRRRRPGVGLG